MDLIYIDPPFNSNRNYTMADLKQVELLAKGVKNWNLWRASESGAQCAIRLGGANLSGFNLRRANLGGAYLREANLTSADLTGAMLGGADLACAWLDEANFREAWLHAANLTSASLPGADFGGASLVTAVFAGLTARRTHFANAICASTTFADIDLSEAKGLENVLHQSPSTIGLDTIYKSQGRIPANFLRGCGVPESFITQMPSLVGAHDGMQFYSCFISYSGKDEEFARRLHGKMRDAHLRVWFAPEDIKGGEKLEEQLETHIRVFDKLLIVLSENSLKSPWVMRELRKAFKAEREAAASGWPKRKLFPVRLCSFDALQDWVCNDSRSGEDLAEEVRQYFIPDFSNWKDHDQFEAAFSRLLKDLKADAKA